LVKDLSWSQATILSLLSGLVSFFIFLFSEVIFGDMLKDVLDATYQAEMYFNINVILYLGLGFVFLSCLLVNLLTLRKYTLGSRTISNAFVLMYTVVILFFISWGSIVVEYSSLYQNLTVINQINLAPHFYGLFSIYILPNPVYFWIFGFIIYHFILIFFIKLCFVRKKSFKKRNK